ncbi:hypothetical protein D3C71_1695270 [compost metagenome]
MTGQRRAAQVFQQQEAVVFIARQHLRHAHAVGLEQVMHAQPRPHILKPRRGVHHDVAAARAGGAPVAAETGIDRGTVERGGRIAEGGAGPLPAMFSAQRIGSRIVHGRVRRSGAGWRAGKKGAAMLSACC